MALILADFTTIGLCIVLKVPQILSLLKSKSATGISLQSLLLELTAYVIIDHTSLFSYQIITLGFQQVHNRFLLQCLQQIPTDKLLGVPMPYSSRCHRHRHGPPL